MAFFEKIMRFHSKVVYYVEKKHLINNRNFLLNTNQITFSWWIFFEWKKCFRIKIVFFSKRHSTTFIAISQLIELPLYWGYVSLHPATSLINWLYVPFLTIFYPFVDMVPSCKLTSQFQDDTIKYFYFPHFLMIHFYFKVNSF